MVALASGVSVASAAPGLVILVGQAMGAETSLRGTWPCSASRASAPQTILIPSVTTVLLQPTLCPSPPPLHQHPSGSWKTRYRLPCFQYLHLLFSPLHLPLVTEGKKRKFLLPTIPKTEVIDAPSPGFPCLPQERLLYRGKQQLKRCFQPQNPGEQPWVRHLLPCCSLSPFPCQVRSCGVSVHQFSCLHLSGDSSWPVSP